MPHGVLAKLAIASGQLGPLPQGSGNPTPHDAKTPSERVDYSMRISRLTVDKLGVKLYDKVSAVIAELIANAYDADATEVTVSAPMGQFLATRAGGTVADKGFKIEVVDNGCGMTPHQVQSFFLVVGAERRNDPKRGSLSPRFERKVMGRKGVGKLAPFGICKTIEVISAGGDRVPGNSKDDFDSGYLTSHIVLDYNGIVALDNNKPDERYKPTTGERDQSISKESGTRIILKDFNYRGVPKITNFNRQLAQRFGLRSENWQIQLLDNTQSEFSPIIVGDFNIETMDNTKIEFRRDHSVVLPNDIVAQDLDAGFNHNDKFYPLSGWMAYSRFPYKDELMAGVRIYCRGKIAAQTSIFNQRAGFTGEHSIRSYLVGELHADWLDEDEDLIQTDRRDILWSDELAAAFEDWGQKVVKRIGNLSRDPLRKATLQLFLETGNVEARIRDAYPIGDHQSIRESAAELARSFGRTISRGEAEDETVVNELVDLSITLAPHVTLDSMMKEAIADADRPLSVLASFLRTARIAELSSFGRIAEDRLKVLKRLEFLKDAEDTNENNLQQLITDAPWLINPEWAPVTANQSFSSLRKAFEKYYENQTGQRISLGSFENTGKRPDFVLSSQEGIVQIIEIKKPHHALTNVEMDRIVKYHDNMDEFLENSVNEEFRRHFADFHITLVCDDLALTGAQRAAFNGYRGDQGKKGRLTHMGWTAFLLKTEQVHQDFLSEAQRQRNAMPSVSQDD
ncbi:MAG: ATP-binding protein [Gemmatimonadota bacterium]|nr:ATP-binding protein [Cyanobacteria bacterium MAG IRC4_bin_6]MDE2698765.1 ATP-binding protein [Gemmatimonadota bacterium]